mgnify:CR=1 FL=1
MQFLSDVYLRCQDCNGLRYRPEVLEVRIERQGKSLNVADVLNAICDKLIERHPHIYGDVIATDEKTVKENWEKIKLKTGNKS